MIQLGNISNAIENVCHYYKNELNQRRIITLQLHVISLVSVFLVQNEDRSRKTLLLHLHNYVLKTYIF